MTADPTNSLATELNAPAVPRWLDLAAIFGEELLEQIAALTVEATDLGAQVQDLLSRARAADDAWGAALTGQPEEALLRTDHLFPLLSGASGLEGLSEACYRIAGGDAGDAFGRTLAETFV